MRERFGEIPGPYQGGKKQRRARRGAETPRRPQTRTGKVRGAGHRLSKTHDQRQRQIHHLLLRRRTSERDRLPYTGVVRQGLRRSGYTSIPGLRRRPRNVTSLCRLQNRRPPGAKAPTLHRHAQRGRPHRRHRGCDPFPPHRLPHHLQAADRARPVGGQQGKNRHYRRRQQHRKSLQRLRRSGGDALGNRPLPNHGRRKKDRQRLLYHHRRGARQQTPLQRT